MKNLPRNAAAFGLFLLFVLPFLVILYLLISEIETGIRFAERERIGLEYIKAVRNFVQKVQQHRTVATGHAVDAAAIRKAAGEVHGTVAQLNTIDQRLGRELRAGELWKALRGRWRELQVDSAAGAKSSFGHDVLVTEANSLVVHVGDTSSLILDPDLDAYHFMNATVVKLLPVAERLEQSRSLGLGAAARQIITPDEKAVLITRIAAIRDARADLDRGISVAFQYNQSLRAALPT